MDRIYIDHAATSPMHPRVIERILEVMQSDFGNPSSIHYYGRSARNIVDEARESLARSIGAHAADIIFTSGGTEADNLAILGTAAGRPDGGHIITTEIEHHAVLHTCRQLEQQGFEVTYLPVDETGIIKVEDVRKALRDDTILVTIMYGNNEVGTIQPIKAIGAVLKDHPAYFHTDAVQAYGLEKLDVSELNVDFLSVSAHKINGPKGIGFLYKNKDAKLFSPRMYGGEQERKRRAGTENVASIAGFQEAAAIVSENREESVRKYREFKRVFMSKLEEAGVEFCPNGLLDNTLPHVLNLSFPGTNVESMLVNLDLAGIAASSGSACTAGSIDPSHVLVAMFGKNSGRLANSIRFSFGFTNSVEQIEKAGEETAKIIQRLRK
ncbi:cysteine desulfurase family protein [Bacillus infantis]|uniref:cysteine desulfurase family protein n=1 Tax=Bacillus infantis TaxID=324767 RepID=UPI002155DF40|nr:cysteine desulfurase family protein [Bacillus infantis]MCR6612111.1 cysteine desulfurase [Bacillus infantis]